MRTLASVAMLFSLSIPLTLLPAAPSRAQQNYASLILGSAHIGSDTLNNNTPGLTIGRRRDVANTHLAGLEYHAEGGVFYNSYEEISPILLAGASIQVAEIAGGEFRLGASFGTAYYKAHSEVLETEYGIPNIGGFIPMAVLTASWRHDRAEYRISTVPPAEDTKAIFNFSVAIAF